jgi:hypothetical protein
VVLAATAVAISGCGDGLQRYSEFTAKTGQIRPGMEEAAVRRVLGVPSATLTGAELAEQCEASGSASAIVYEFLHANGWQKLVNKMIGSNPQVTRFIVCIDSNHNVTKTRSNIMQF